MSIQLTEHIIKHIYKCLGVKLPNKQPLVNSIMQDKYLLDCTVNFDDGQKNKIWGVDLKNESGDITILLADCQQESVPEFACLVKVDGAEACYGCYLVYAELDAAKELESQPMIAINIGGGGWTECNVYLQGTFLVGMERIKDFNCDIVKTNKEKYYENLLEFIKYYQNKMEL